MRNQLCLFLVGFRNQFCFLFVCLFFVCFRYQESVLFVCFRLQESFRLFVCVFERFVGRRVLFIWLFVCLFFCFVCVMLAGISARSVIFAWRRIQGQF